jgi:hypothetical protein
VAEVTGTEARERARELLDAFAVEDAPYFGETGDLERDAQALARDVLALADENERAVAEAATLRQALERAAYVALNLLGQVPEFTGVVGPGGEREDDYIALNLYEEIQGWAALAAGEASR